MRKLFSYCGAAASKVCLTLMLLMGFAAAYAATPITEVNQALEAGVTYSYGQYTKVSAMYTPTKSGTLRVEGFQSFGIYGKCITPGEQYDEQNNNWTAMDPVAAVRTFTVNAGQPVYFFLDFTWDAGEVTLYMEGENVAPLKIQYMQPLQNQLVDFNNYPSMSVTFNQKITLGDNNAIISFQNRLTGATQEIAVRATAANQTLSVPLYANLKPYIASEAIKPGDPFSVLVKGLVSDSGEPYQDAAADGSITFNFLCGSIPVVANQQYCPNPFLSYWPAGTPEGILKITFDKTLGQSDKTVATLGWGNQEGEDGEYYVEQLPVMIDGNTLSVDFTGKLRTPATMTPLFPQASYNTIAIDITGVVDEHGVPVGSPGAGTVGSYGFSPAYKVLERTSIAAEFEPAAGADLNLASNLNVWISGIKNFTFDGFKIQYTDKNTGLQGSVVVPMSDVKITPDGDDAAEYAFAMPKEVVDNASTAVVTLNDMSTLDGYNHENDVRAVYGGFVITYADPANGAEMASLTEGTLITIETNVSEKYPNMYVEYEIRNLNPGEDEEEILKSTSWMARQENGSYTSEVYGNYKMLYGKEYQVVFTAWEDEMTKNYTPQQTLGTDFIIWTGTTPPYRYSVIELTDVTPGNDATIEPGQNEMTVTFDGIVRIGANSGIVSGMGGGISKFPSMTPVNPEDVNGTTYASTWVFGLGELASRTEPTLISFQAIDEEGRLVKGNEGIDETTCFQFTYYPSGMFQEITVDFGAQPLASVKEITVSNALGLGQSYEFPDSDIKVYDKMYNVVATMSYYEPIFINPDDWSEVSKSGKIVLDNAITASGTYSLIIPRGFFNIGTDFSSYKNDAVNFLFTIEAPYSVIPEEGTVEALSTVTVTYAGGNIKINEETGDKPTFTFSGEEGEFWFGDATAEGAELTLTFRADQTEAGTYTVNVPAGFVLFEDGSEAPAVTVVYTIEEAGGVPSVTVIPAQGKVSVLPETVTIYFDDYEMVGPGQGKATLTFNNEAPVYLPDAIIDENDFDAWNKMLQPLGQEYTAEGTYVITFPAGYFNHGENGKPVAEFTLTYVIGKSGGGKVNVTTIPAQGQVTSIPSTITIYFNDKGSVNPGDGVATLSIDDAAPVELPKADVDWDDWDALNKMLQPMGQEYSADGTYVISFPEGYFFFGENYEPSPAFTITYTIGENTGVEIVDVMAKEYTVYTINGLRVLDRADRDAFKALAPGLYIVNGVKMVVK